MDAICGGGRRRRKGTRLIIIKALFVGLLLLASYSGARRFLIPNILPLLLFALGGVAWFAGFPFAEPFWSHLLHFAIALAIGMALFHWGWFGGGDVKLYAALAFWFAMPSALLLLLAVALSGLLVVVGAVAIRLVGTIARPSIPAKEGLMKRRIAYGVAIAIGGVFTMLWVYP